MTAVKEANPARAGEVAQQIVELLVNEDADTRRRAIQAAVTLLGDEPPQLIVERDQPIGSHDDSHVSVAQFFDRGEKLRPADYAQLCSAYHYSIYGPAPFSLDEIRTLGADAGVVLPDRLDKTFKSAAHAGKKLFQSVGRGVFKPTAAAGMVFGDRWHVKPGRRTKATAVSKGKSSA